MGDFTYGFVWTDSNVLLYVEQISQKAGLSEGAPSDDERRFFRRDELLRGEEESEKERERERGDDDEDEDLDEAFMWITALENLRRVRYFVIAKKIIS